MQMTAEEICRHYTQASNKSKDIQVLADLNATATACPGPSATRRSHAPSW